MTSTTLSSSSYEEVKPFSAISVWNCLAASLESKPYVNVTGKISSCASLKPGV